MCIRDSNIIIICVLLEEHSVHISLYLTSWHTYFNHSCFSPVVFQALCLEQLTARELLARVVEKLNLSPENISSLVRLTSTGILVLVDDIVS